MTADGARALAAALPQCKTLVSLKYDLLNSPCVDTPVGGLT